MRSQLFVLLVMSMGLAFGAVAPVAAANLDLSAYRGKVVYSISGRRGARLPAVVSRG